MGARPRAPVGCPVNAHTARDAAILAWCDHVESRAKPNERVRDPRVNAYADGFRDGVLEALAQVRQAVLHDFDVAALDGRPAHAD